MSDQSSSSGSALTKRTADGMAPRAARLVAVRFRSSIVVPSHTFGQPVPQALTPASGSGSILAMFCGRLVSSSQSRCGVCSTRRHKSSRQDAGTWLSNTSASEAQNTLRRIPAVAASRFHLAGCRQ